MSYVLQKQRLDLPKGESLTLIDEKMRSIMAIKNTLNTVLFKANRIILVKIQGLKILKAASTSMNERFGLRENLIQEIKASFWTFCIT